MKFSKHDQQYESDLSKFIKDLKKKDPLLEQKQRAGRAIFWDKDPIDLDTQKRTQESRIQQQAYVYQNKF